MGMSHLGCLETRASRARERFRLASTEAERAFRLAEIESAERELAGEKKFLGIENTEFVGTDDDLLLALGL